VEPTGYIEKSDRVPSYWEKLCTQWAKMIQRYCRDTNCQDPPYLHNERANVGFIAAAAWAVGKIALEEYHSRRLSGGTASRARPDLWISRGGDSDLFEAKILKFGFPDNIGDAKSLLLEATEKVLSVKEPYPDPYNRRFALLVCAIGVRVRPTELLLPPAERCIAGLQSLAVDSIAWTIPRGMRRTPPDPGQRLRWEYPGAAILLRRVDRRRTRYA